MDSMLVYRGMDLGTAKPSVEERGSIRHHLIDLVEPWQTFSVARYLEAAEQAEAEVRARGARPLYVGGTGLYLKALTSGLLQVPQAPARLRNELEQQWAQGGEQLLRDELQRIDPAAAERLHPSDAKRILRAIEVYRCTGRPLSEWQRQWQRQAALREPAVALIWPREILRERIAERFDAMLDAGLVEEIQRIRARGGFSLTAAKALGYRQILQALDGEIGWEEAREQAITKTRVLIRRQMSWLRSFPDLHCQEVGPEDRIKDLAAALLARFQGWPGPDLEDGSGNRPTTESN